MPTPPPQPWGLYVHVPWCTRRCPYCAFYVEVERDTPWEHYADAIEREHAERRPTFAAHPPSTLYFGGGTPSRLPVEVLRRLITSLEQPDHIGLEANPEDLDEAHLNALRDAGITRLSVGVQTFNPDFARLLNRASTVEHARAMTRAIARAGFNSWSLDLIFALPNQTLDDLKRDIDAVLEAAPPHISLYGLTYEPGTAFERARKAGKFSPLPEALWSEMYETIVTRLNEAGVERYEVSNFAKKGHQSAHNLLYWTDAPYLGLGPSAHGYAPDGARWANPSNANAYLSHASPLPKPTQPTAEEHAIDLLFSTLRCSKGLCLKRLARRSGATVDPAVIHSLVKAGLIKQVGARIHLRHSGFPVADGLTSRLVRALSFEAARASEGKTHPPNS